MVLRNFHTGIAVERTDTQAQIVRVFDLSLDDRRPTTPAKHPMIPRRRLPLLEQFICDHESKRRSRNRRPAGERRAGHFPTKAAMTIRYRAQLAVDLIFHTATKT